MRPVSPGALTAVWVDVLERRLRAELEVASPGQCLRVADLPRPLLEEAACRLSAAPVPGCDVFLVSGSSGPEPWIADVYTVIRRRNEEETAVLALIPPDIQLAAGDSVDVSTFRLIAVKDLLRQVEQTLYLRIPEWIRRHPLRILSYLATKGWNISDTQRLLFLATIAEQGSEGLSTLGGALYQLGLIPDFALLADPEHFHHRLGQLNMKMVEQLSDQSATVLERVFRLPAKEPSFRSHLLDLFREYRPDDITTWGAVVATNSRWRDLSLDEWPVESEVTTDLRIFVEPLKLPRRTEDGFLVFADAEKSKLTVAWQTAPPPVDVPDLAYFRVELVSSDRVVAWESPFIKAGGKASKKSKSFKGLAGVEEGVYFLRVIGLTHAGDPFPQQPARDETSEQTSKRINESEDFLVRVGTLDASDEDDVVPVSRPVVTGYAEALMVASTAALKAGREPRSSWVATTEWVTPLEASAETAVAHIQFGLQYQYAVRVSQRLRRLEVNNLANPAAGGRFVLSLGRSADESRALPVRLPPDFATAREELFPLLLQNNPTEGGTPLVCMANLVALAPHIERYAEAYRAWLATGDEAALLIDITEITVPELGTCALVSPTHPLRILWLLQRQELAKHWIEVERDQGLDDNAPETWRKSLSPQGIPALLTFGAGFLDAGPLLGGWEAYLPLQRRDSRALLAALRSGLGCGAAHASEADISPQVLADKLDIFLRQHPYTPALVLNVINPGDAALVVDSVVELEERRGENAPPVRYVIRLFTETAHGDIGSAFRQIMDPERQISEAADRLLAPGASFLFPKLTWSRNDLAEFLQEPQRFPAHVTLILDAFPVSLRVARLDFQDRSSFVHGLVQEAPKRIAGPAQAFSWIRRPSPRACTELPGAPDRSGLIAAMLAGMGSLQAQALAPNMDVADMTAVVALDLGVSGQSLLYSTHAVSTWVLTIDPHLGLDYFDSARPFDRPGYLLDFTPEFIASGGRQLLLTTRIDAEVAGIIAPAAEQLDLEPDGPGVPLLIEALRSLSGRLALRLTSSPSQVRGALGMALSRLFLEAFGLLDDAIVIPLDAHPELSQQPDSSASQLRGDLLVVSADPDHRQLDFLLVETKYYSGIGLNADLRAGIAAQLESSETALRAAFDPDFSASDRIDRVVQNWRLTTVLQFYLERAVRYGLVRSGSVDELRRFFLSLDAGYSLKVSKRGLVFRLDSEESFEDTENPEVPVWVFGQDTVGPVVVDALRAYKESGITVREGEAPGAPTRNHITDEVTWTRVRRSLGGPSIRGSVTYQPRGEQEPHTAPSDTGSSTPPTLVAEESLSPSFPESDLSQGAGMEEKPQQYAPDSPPQFDVLLGDTKPTPQYGLIGSIAAEPWRRIALDLNGCNTISVFGVQGSGKSYTVGSIIEMATQAIPRVNLLPHPLGAVVFHYHQTQDYPPEFVSMTEPNDDLRDLEALGGWQARAEGLRDVLVLTTADTLQRRRSEFPDAQIAPIAFSSAELTVADWRFLMGATGNDALYLKLINEVMRKSRDNLSLDAIRAGMETAPLSESQRALAEARLDFAARFVDDSVSLRSLLQPGRLVVVDLRDEFVEKGEALGLFVTMLNVFAGAGMGVEPFNKLIVFDEAHKYMGGSLIGQVVEVIRQMRHKGVTVAVASQDPINVPPAIIELSSAVVLHRFNSPSWVKHIQKSLAPVGELTAPMLASLMPGEAFVWANKATDQTFVRRAVKVRMRPRITKHGGSTRRASDI